MDEKPLSKTQIIIEEYDLEIRENSLSKNDIPEGDKLSNRLLENKYRLNIQTLIIPFTRLSLIRNHFIKDKGIPSIKYNELDDKEGLIINVIASSRSHINDVLILKQHEISNQNRLYSEWKDLFDYIYKYCNHILVNNFLSQNKLSTQNSNLSKIKIDEEIYLKPIYHDESQNIEIVQFNDPDVTDVGKKNLINYINDTCKNSSLFNARFREANLLDSHGDIKEEYIDSIANFFHYVPSQKIDGAGGTYIIRDAKKNKIGHITLRENSLDKPGFGLYLHDNAMYNNIGPLATAMVIKHIAHSKYGMDKPNDDVYFYTDNPAVAHIIKSRKIEKILFPKSNGNVSIFEMLVDKYVNGKRTWVFSFTPNMYKKARQAEADVTLPMSSALESLTKRDKVSKVNLNDKLFR